MYQIFFVRASKNLPSRIIRVSIGLISMVGYISLVQLLITPLPPEELKVATGIYEKYGLGRSRGNLTIRYDNGKKDKFKGTLEYKAIQKLNNLKGKYITVYYSYSLNALLFKYKELAEIKNGDEYISDGYNQAHYQRLLFFRRIDKIIVSVWLGITFIGLFATYLLNRKSYSHDVHGGS
ncbi:MAG: hypothetical protein ED859_18185 [Desulfuromonadales bacterium]|nr:MAG: hypothetical protein ED859_18185 [Desulfuromonadales bacterium]